MSESEAKHFSYPKYTQDEWDGLEDENTRLRKLITELAEAVQYCHVYRINDATIAEHRELMQRAREATKWKAGAPA